MICVDRIVRFKNMEVFTINYLDNFDVTGLTDYASHEEIDEATYSYYKRIGEHYGVKFESGEYSPEKMEHLSQD